MRRALPAVLVSCVPLFGVIVSGCGYAPPPATNTQSPQYEADLDACQASTSKAVNTRNAKTGLRWFASGVTRWPEIDDGVAACMTGKGYGRVRTCTAEELRTGGGGRTVTAVGVRCSDPPTAPGARPADTAPPAPAAPAGGGEKRRS